MVLPQWHVPQSGEVWDHSSRYVSLPAVISSCSQFLCFIFRLNSYRQGNHSWSHSRLQANIRCSCVHLHVHFHLRALHHIRSSVTDDVATSTAVALIHSRLDYANSLLYGISSTNTHKLQRCQNTAAGLILHYSSYIVLVLFNTSWTGFTGCQFALGLTLKSSLWLTVLLANRRTFMNYSLRSPYQPSPSFSLIALQ